MGKRLASFPAFQSQRKTPPAASRTAAMPPATKGQIGNPFSLSAGSVGPAAGAAEEVVAAAVEAMVEMVVSVACVVSVVPSVVVRGAAVVGA